MMKDDKPTISRRRFLNTCARKLPQWMLIGHVLAPSVLLGRESYDYNPDDHLYAMGVDIHKCIGCGRCADSCKNENKVPREPFFLRNSGAR